MPQSIDLTSFKTKNAYDERIRFIILHYTALPFDQSIKALTEGHVSAHYIIGNTEDPTYPFKEVRAFHLVEENKRAWHAGVSSWKNCHTLNDSSLGIEITLTVPEDQSISPPAAQRPNLPSFPPYPQESIECLIHLLRHLLAKYPTIKPDNIIGHSDIAYTRKLDPGPTFPWETLHKNGIGAWFKQEDFDYFYQKFQSSPPHQKEIDQIFATYGYDYPPTLSPTEKSMAIKAFQMHFRPQKITGTWDIECLSILYALYKRYIQTA